MGKYVTNGAVLFFFLLSAGLAFGSNTNDFEPVPPADYFAMIKDASLALDAKRYDEAFTKFQRLACAGDKVSQANLGSMYFLGQGTARDDLKGYEWLKVAAEYDFPAYRSTVRKIEKQLTPQQLAYATEGAEKLRSLYGLHATSISCSATSSSSFNSNLKNSLVCTPASLSSQVLLRRCVQDDGAAAKQP